MADVIEIDAATGQTTTRDLTPEEVAVQQSATAKAAEDAAKSANAEAIRVAATAALQTDRAFLGIATPSNAQMSAQLKELTRQNIGIIRLVLGKLDATD